MIEVMKRFCNEQISFLNSLYPTMKNINMSHKGMISAYKYVLMELEKQNSQPDYEFLYEQLKKDLYAMNDKYSPYMKAFKELKDDIKEQIDLLQNWCDECEVCVNIPKPRKEIKYDDLNDKLQELSEKYNLDKE